MWKSQINHDIKIQEEENDDWETDPDFVNDLTEEEQRWGSKNGRCVTSIDMQKLRDDTEKSDKAIKTSYLKDLNSGFGYGGKFGVQKDRVDKSALSWDHVEKVEKHESQKDYAKGFGGKFGVQSDRVDKSAVGWDHVEKVEKHESQKDYAKGFGGKFGVQSDRVDQSAVGWDHVEKVEKHESQLDHKKGFGGKFGIQKDRMDKMAMGFDESKQTIGTNYTKTKPDIGGAKPSNLRAKFENLAKSSEEEAKRKAEEQKRLREEKDRKDREEASKKVVVESKSIEASSRVDKPIINTGRSGGIGNAISVFNQMQSPTSEQPAKRKDPIIIPKEESVPSAIVSPTKISPPITNLTDNLEKIPSASAAIQTINPSPLQTVKVNSEVEQTIKPDETINNHEPQLIEEPIYQNNSEVTNNGHHQEQLEEASPLKEPQQQISSTATSEPIYQNNEEAYNLASHETLDDEEAIYQNQEDIAYIEDTGIKAIALYDYQAAADDEISFDPDEIITHIEMIDEGWWRGLCRNRYGLFPANYVQLIEQQHA